jgi:uncharacterized protein YjbI with pentapeptide repeats
LIRADLSGSDLSGANFSGADLSRVLLRFADLTGANLSGADLTGADLSGADLTGADLTGVDATEADLGGAVLKNVRGLETMKGSSPPKSHFHRRASATPFVSIFRSSHASILMKASTEQCLP